MHEIRADRMSPMNKTPERLAGIVLVEEMVFVVDFDQAVRIVEPVGWSRKMVCGSRVHADLRG